VTLQNRFALLLLAMLALVICNSPSRAAAFGLRPGSEGFAVSAREENGAIDHQAGSHPYVLSTEVNFVAAAGSPGEPGVPFAEGDVRDLGFDLPPGLIENPAAVPQCTQSAFHTPRESPYETSLSGESCPDKSQIGVATIHTSYGGGTTLSFGIYNLVPAPGAPSEVGFNPFGSPFVFRSEIHQAEGVYQLSLQAGEIPQRVSISGLKLEIWGAPWFAAHNFQRGNCLNESNSQAPRSNSCAINSTPLEPPLAYLTLPSSCQVPMVYGVTADSYQQPAVESRRQFAHFDQGEPLDLEGCGAIPFEPAPRAQIANPRASSPSGYEFDLDVGSEGLLRPRRVNPTAVRKAVVTLPEGMTINPSVGSGLIGCTPAQYTAETVSSAPGEGCPNGSKIGDFTVQSPLFGQPVEGSLYLAAPFDNPFSTLIGVYLVAKAPERGVLVKVAGRLDADPASGRLVATFDGLPQLPYTNLRIHFREGQRSPLATPAVCGAFTTGIELTPWNGAASTLAAAATTPITSGVGGAACPEGTPGFHPGVVSGSINSQAGAFSPFYLRLDRTDTEQEITSYSATLPTGLLGKIGNIPYCSDAAIEAARHRGGFEETEHPSCPAATSIGHTVVGYGVGPALTFAPGGLYLAGPFHGSTFSIVAIDSATVGPFDLGTVVVRSAIDVNPQTAQVSIDSAGTDPIPHIIDGIPIHLRDIRVYIDRPGFTVNPTSCQPFAVVSTLTGSGARFSDPSDDTSATATAPYQAFNCASLPFKPNFSLHLKGGTKRGQFPALRAEVRPRSGDANIGAAIVALPPSEFLEQSHIGTVCTRPQFSREACPAASVYGSARAFSPLLNQPLEGPVYLRSSSNKLPDLVADLHGGGLGLRIELDGRIDSLHGGLRATFETIPDAPVSKFELTLNGGKKGLLVNSEDTCAAPQFAQSKFVGQNNVAAKFQTRLQVKCSKTKTKKKTGGDGK
jgi:hypothetical protein